MVHLRQRVEHAWPDGIILVCKLSSGREASDTVRSRESQAAGAGRIYTTSSWLKGRDSFTTPGVLDSSIPFQYTCSSRPTSMIQGTGFAPSVLSTLSMCLPRPIRVLVPSLSTAHQQHAHTSASDLVPLHPASHPLDQRWS